MDGYIYIIQTREFVNNGMNVYKVGYTNRSIHKRMNEFPKGTIQCYMCLVRNASETEKILINELSKRYNRKSEYGKKYFEGPLDSLIFDTIAIINSLLIRTNTIPF